MRYVSALLSLFFVLSSSVCHAGASCIEEGNLEAMTALDYSMPIAVEVEWKTTRGWFGRDSFAKVLRKYNFTISYSTTEWPKSSGRPPEVGVVGRVVGVFGSEGFEKMVSDVSKAAGSKSADWRGIFAWNIKQERPSPGVSVPNKGQS